MDKYVSEQKTILEIIIESVGFFIIGSIAGIARYMHYLFENKDDEKVTFKLIYFFALAFLGGFVGWAVAEILSNWLERGGLLFGLTGAAGAVGLQIFYVLINTSLKIFGKQSGIETEIVKDTEQPKPKRKPKTE